MPALVSAGPVQQQPGGGRGAGYPGQHARAACAQCEKQPNYQRNKRVQVQIFHNK